MSGFIIGFCCGIGWVPLYFIGWCVIRAFSGSLDLGE